MRYFNIILIIWLTFGYTCVFSQNQLSENTANNTTMKYQSEGSLKKSETRKFNVSDEDTVIVTPVSKIIVKKKDFYTGNHSRPVIQQEDSIITTPNSKKIIRKSNNSKK